MTPGTQRRAASPVKLDQGAAVLGVADHLLGRARVRVRAGVSRRGQLVQARAAAGSPNGGGARGAGASGSGAREDDCAKGD